MRPGSRRLGALVILGLAVAAVPAGVMAGRFAAERLSPYQSVTLTMAALDPGGPTAVTPMVVIRRDGAAVGLSGPGYERLQVDDPTNGDLRRLLDGASAWRDSYPVQGPIAGRLLIRLGGAGGRTVSVDSPLANTTLPDSLYRFIVTVERQFAAERPDAVQAAAPAYRVYLRASAVPAGVAAVPLPGGLLDLSTASSASGQPLDQAGFARLADSVPGTGTLVYPLNAAYVSLDGADYLLTWVADWTSWAEAGA